MLHNCKRPIEDLVHHFSDIYALFTFILLPNHLLEYIGRDACVRSNVLHAFDAR